MSSEKSDGEEIVIGPHFGCGKHSFYRRYQDGELIDCGIGERTEGPGPAIAFGPVKENGRRDVKGHVVFNAPGSTVHSGGNSRAFVDGWERTFRKASGASKAN